MSSNVVMVQQAIVEVCKKRFIDKRMMVMPNELAVRVAMEVIAEEFKDDGCKKVPKKLFVAKVVDFLQILDTTAYLEKICGDMEDLEDER